MLGVVSPYTLDVVVAPAFTWLFTFIPCTSLPGRDTRASRQAAGARETLTRILVVYLSPGARTLEKIGDESQYLRQLDRVDCMVHPP